jgi:hypothetical protein
LALYDDLAIDVWPKFLLMTRKLWIVLVKLKQFGPVNIFGLASLTSDQELFSFKVFLNLAAKKTYTKSTSFIPNFNVVIK